MLFASTELAARVERAEAALIGDSAGAAARQRPDAGTVRLPIGGGVACYAGPGSPLNKVAGVGFPGPIDPADLDAVERMCAERAIPVQVELSSLADAAVAPMLSERGYRLVGFENVLGMGLPAPAAPRAAGGVAVEECADDRASDWLDAVVTGFASPDAEGVPSHESFPREAIEAAISDMAGAAGLTRYLATLDGALAGGASMRTHEGVAHLCGAATLPACRRRGVQTALLHRRLADAAGAGCDLAVVTTQPGSPSQRNAQARGFELLYVRAVLVKAP